MFKRKVFTTISFSENPQPFDYPKGLPIPRIGETVVFEYCSGVVSDVRHITSGRVTKIKILVRQT